MARLGAWLEDMLYQSCGFLTREQILSMKNSNKDGTGLLHWYGHSLRRDFIDNYENIIEREKYQKEAERVGITLERDEDGRFSLSFKGTKLCEV